MEVKKLSQHARLPTRGTEYSAGYDLYSPVDCILYRRTRTLIKLDIAVRFLNGHYAQIKPRSSLAIKGIDTGAGVIDSDYRGNIGVLLFNHSENDIPINKGDRIAQMVLIRISTPDVVEVDELDDTQRGEGGYGSTGK